MTTISDFARSERGTAFFARYDRLLHRWPSGSESLYIAGTFGTTHVRACGAGDAPPIVLLPGAGATAAVWVDAIATLAHDRRVFAVDLMGDPGRSRPGTRGMCDVDDLIDWLDETCAALSSGPVEVVGHSYGAMVALAFALRQPERLTRLVLLDPNSCFAGMAPAYLLRAIPTLFAASEARTRRLLEWEIAGSSVDSEWFDLAVVAAGFPARRPVVPPRPRRPQIAVPTRVVLAGRSRVHDSARVASALARRHPDIGVEVIDEATHHTLPRTFAAAPGLPID